MRYVDYYEELDPDKFLEFSLEIFLPELHRVSSLRNSRAFDEGGADFAGNFMLFILYLGHQVDVADEACLRITGKAPDKVRIELQTFDNFMIRMRFVPMDGEDTPLLREIDNPILLIFSDKRYFEKFKKEKYSQIKDADISL